MNAQKIIGEIGKGPLQRQEWGNSCDQDECECATCPARIDAERIEVHNGNVVLVLLVAFVVGMAIGIVVGKAM